MATMQPTLTEQDRRYLNLAARMQRLGYSVLFALSLALVISYLWMLDHHPARVDSLWLSIAAGLLFMAAVTATMLWREQRYLSIIARLQRDLIQHRLRDSEATPPHSIS
ncbi:MAG: hypothetical protein HKM02_07785 [Pseudomonadales bacterium]|nr:hypothetical protein [Pseudomonadales bacterium]